MVMMMLKKLVFYVIESDQNISQSFPIVPNFKVDREN